MATIGSATATAGLVAAMASGYVPTSGFSNQLFFITFLICAGATVLLTAASD